MICGHCKNDHDTVDEVRACYGARPDANTYHDDDTAETVVPNAGESFFLGSMAQNMHDHHVAEMERQQEEVHRDRTAELRGEHPGAHQPSTFMQNYPKTYLVCPFADKDKAKALGAKWDPAKRQWYVPAGISTEGFERWIPGATKKSSTYQSALPDRNAPVEPDAEPAPDGFYNYNGSVAKVVHNQAGTRQYAYVLQVRPKSEQTEKKGADWVYSPGVHGKLTLADQLTQEQAVEFGQLYSICGICGAMLSDPASIERGIGPVCARNLGW